jgi:hypothetical protein
MTTPNPGHVSPAIGEYQLEILKTELAQEKRDHDETRRQLNSSNQMIEGFERTVKALAADIDRKDLLLLRLTKLIEESIKLFDQVKAIGSTEV